MDRDKILDALSSAYTFLGHYADEKSQAIDKAKGGPIQ